MNTNGKNVNNGSEFSTKFLVCVWYMLLLKDKVQGWEKQKKPEMMQRIFPYLITLLRLLLFPNLEVRERIPNIILSLQGEDTMSVLLEI